MWVQVRMTMGKVEERLWSIIRSFATLGRDRPAMLVNAVRIIELQELVDKSLEASTGGETVSVRSPACAWHDESRAGAEACAPVQSRHFKGGTDTA